MTSAVFVLNGPNLNLLGKRQPHIYGHETLADVEERCRGQAAHHGLDIRFHQSNMEGQIIDWIHEARDHGSAIVINPGAFTHTSVAILDALNAFDGPVFEVHISNVHKRESFRHHSYVSLRADGVIAGFGTQGYLLAIERVASLIKVAAAEADAVS
ncbi:type II 3-dehydroquinate dehydratase [Roseibium sp.]|uniref:type II 3-dehydroquinate dehydratase n=1 Tax=Roseibium sp. TaxID=1936156 RepID=UPI003D10E0F1